MKKKVFIGAAVAAVLAASLSIPQVSAFAMSALSVFRIEGTNTITITLEDITNAATYMNGKAKDYETLGQESLDKIKELTNGQAASAVDGPDITDMLSIADKAGESGLFDGEAVKKAFIANHTRSIADVSEFTDFDVKLPSTDSGIAPEMAVIELGEHGFTLPNEQKVYVSFTPIFMAHGEDWTYIATERFTENISDETKQKIKDYILELPFISENLHSQIEAVPIDTKDIYLPVIEGVSRSANIGGETGYIYAASDLQMILSALSQATAVLMPKELDGTDGNLTAIVWVSDGVLNILAGGMSEAELISLAGSAQK